MLTESNTGLHILDLFRTLQKPSEISFMFTISRGEEAGVQGNDVPGLPLHSTEGDLTGENQVKYPWAHKINTKWPNNSFV